MIGYYTADQIRAAEESTGELLTGGVLMARAANGVARVAAAELVARCDGVYGRRVGMVVGAGNNGGDALYAGALLRRRGVAVDAVLLAPDAAHPGGLAAFRRAGGRVTERLAPDTDLVIDAVVGLGGRGPLRPNAAEVFAGVFAPVLAVDLPSGVDPDTGVVHEPSVRADVCVTFGERRLAHLLAAPSCGRIEVIDIGLDLSTRLVHRWGRQRKSIETGNREPGVACLTDRDVALLWPRPGPQDDKYSQGVVGIVAGSDRYPGAAVLSTAGSVAATSGMTRFVGSAAPQVVAHRPEVVAVTDFDDAGRVQAWVVGPGLGTDGPAEELVERVLATELPVLVDANALTVVARRPELLERDAPTLLTPHAGEFERLAGAPVGADRLTAVRELAARLNSTVLLKGRITLIAEPGGGVLGNDAGGSAAATAGAGDVLAGIAGALLAVDRPSSLFWGAERPPMLDAAAAARVHAVAALLASGGGTIPIGASDLVAAVPEALRRVLDPSSDRSGEED
ncbi:MAG: NAD(P)H-hydrate dehydratase [Gordonia sp. (in: high G+C Gram-positive bacteria)]|uniref:NAD(P)H-hydrate dehydratase n=1 Tax=Gordonia sp. (in: high G+C Gram-positive bacteria) TaxID=84139 RepID=UPI0039E4E027